MCAAETATTFVIAPDADPLHLGVRKSDGTEQWLPIETPTAYQYDKLIRNLALASGRLDAGHDDLLEAAAHQLADCIHFLHEDRAVFVGGASRPLRWLITALLDVISGARPPLIFDRERPSNKPGATSFDFARGQSAVALEILASGLMRTGQATASGWMKTGQAAEWVAKELSRLGLMDPDGQSITPHRLRRWREDISQGIAARGVADTFDAVMELERERLPTSIEDAQSRCRVRLEALKAVFVQPPSR